MVTEVQNKMFGKADITKKQTKNYVLSPQQYQEVTKQVNAAVIIKKDYKRLRQTDFVKENNSLKEHAKHYMSQNTKLKKEKSQLQKEVGTLNTEISSLQAHIRDLQANIKVLYQQTKKVFKEQFKAFIGIIKNELDNKGIDNQFEREHRREIRRHRDFDRER
ncbi:recombinase [Bacillus wiedmannii]|nr:recombinase [Bacillus wiedmannii]